LSIERCIQGTVRNCKFEVLDGETGLRVDPSTATLRYVCGDSEPVTLVYAGASTPSVGVLSRIAVGYFQAWIDTTPMTGIFAGYPVTTGVGQAAGKFVFEVIPNEAIGP
jgi:hypothetical protein